MENFTPIAGFIGGIIIGLSAIAFLHFNGKICGISGIFEGCLKKPSSQNAWGYLFILGLLTGGFILHFIYPFAFEFEIKTSYSAIFLGGFFVGFGSRFGGGCTSGHGVCGVGRLEPKSILSTIIFMVTGFVTASTVYAIWGAS